MTRYTACAAAFLALAVFAVPAPAFVPTYADAASPLGTGNMELFLDLEFASYPGGVDASWFMPTFSYGFNEKIDFWGHPHLWLDNGGGESGPGDTTLGIKWNFSSRGEWGFAVSPYITLPTGDEDKGLGTGEVDLGANFIASWTRDRSPWAVNLNFDFFTNSVNGTKCNDYAVAAEVEYGLDQTWTLVGELTWENTGSSNAFCLLGGAAYAVSEDVDLGLGLKIGLNDEAADSILLLGATLSL